MMNELAVEVLIERYDNQISQLTKERDELKRKYGFTYCAYCGAEFQIDAPDSVSAVSQHIATCDKHPMRIVERERDQLAAKCEKLNVELLDLQHHLGVLQLTHPHLVPVRFLFNRYDNKKETSK